MNKPTKINYLSSAVGSTVGYAVGSLISNVYKLYKQYPNVERKLIRIAYRRYLWNKTMGLYGNLPPINPEWYASYFELELENLVNNM